MWRFIQEYRPLMGLGMTSLVLGVIGLLLAFLPVLGIPLSVCGLACGLIGLVGGLFEGGLVLRWGLGGTFLSGMALFVNIAIVYAPAGYTPGPSTPLPWRPPTDRPYVSPPAQGHAAPRPRLRPGPARQMWLFRPDRVTIQSVSAKRGSRTDAANRPVLGLTN
jgi:hypothetical protein